MFKTNILFKEYLISPELHIKLYEAYHNKVDRECKCDNGFYIISMRPINYDNKLIFYSYIYYNIDFLPIIKAAVLTRSQLVYENQHNYFESGRYFVVFESNLIKAEMGNTHIFNGDTYEPQFNDMDDFYYSLFRCFNVSDLNNMCNITISMFNKDYNTLFNNVYPESKGCMIDTFNPNGNLLNNTIFIVKDIKSFINLMKDKSFIINQGLQKYRGTLNSNIKFISDIDDNYRNTMVTHHNKFKNSLDYNTYKHTLDYRHFSFRNIHQNLGQIRWHSTSTNLKNKDKQKNTNNINRQNLLDETYLIISNHIDNNKGKNREELQLEIEKLLRNQENIFSENKDLRTTLKFSEEAFDYLNKKKSDLIKLLSNPNTFKVKGKTYSTEYIHWLNKIINELGVVKTSEIILSYFMQILTKETTYIEDSETPGIPTIKSFHELGFKIFNKYLHSLYIKSDEYKDGKTLNNFVNKNKDQFSDMEVENFYARFGGYFVNTLFTIDLLEEDLDYSPVDSKESIYYIRIHPQARKNLLRENFRVYHLPVKLPMICEPKKYVYSTEVDKNVLGGYLLNDVEYIDFIFKKKMGYDKPTVLEESNTIISLINGLSTTPYKVNTDTLDFIYKYGIEKGLIIDYSTEEINNFMKDPYNGHNKRDSKKLRSTVSKIILERNILNIAETYSRVEKIYFPVRLDQRTRIYCETDYFHYQNTDLAKGLISFVEPGIIYKHDDEVIKYFKAYGANMYGENLDKKSLNHRVKWVDDNSDVILDFENNDIISKAENKTCFVSFCFEYKRFIEFMNNKNSVKFYTHLPIQLDASCNCYQHLALLTKEGKLLNKLNLDHSNYDDTPNDFYTYVLEQSQLYISNQIKELSSLKDRTTKQDSLLKSYMLLEKVQFNRSLVKKVIMTKSYNASIPKQVSLLIEGLDEHNIGREKFYSYKDKDLLFKRGDVVNFVMVLKNVINLVSPRIKELSKYLDTIVSICTKLGIPIPWVLPSGAKIFESYLVEKKINIKAFSFVKSRYTFKKYEKKYDLSKQKRATMPNLIHSLDATSIAMLYTDFNAPIYTVHDCFAVTCNNVPKLINSLKWVYMKLYSDQGYLLHFDKLLRLTINSTFGDNTFKLDGDNIIILEGNKTTKMTFPDVKKIINLNVNNKISNLEHSSYLII